MSTTEQPKQIKNFYFDGIDGDYPVKGKVTVTLKGSTNGVYYNEDASYYRLSLVGELRYVNSREPYTLGQLNHTIKEIDISEQDVPTVDDLLELWKDHLNCMNAGTVEQHAHIEKINEGKYDYTRDCKLLKEADLYEVDIPGRDKKYKYGYEWLYWPLSDKSLKILKSFGFEIHE